MFCRAGADRSDRSDGEYSDSTAPRTTPRDSGRMTEERTDTVRSSKRSGRSSRYGYFL